MLPALAGAEDGGAARSQVIRTPRATKKILDFEYKEVVLKSFKQDLEGWAGNTCKIYILCN